MCVRLNHENIQVVRYAFNSNGVRDKLTSAFPSSHWLTVRAKTSELCVSCNYNANKPIQVSKHPGVIVGQSNASAVR